MSSTNLSQLQRQFNYLKYEIKNLSPGGDIPPGTNFGNYLYWNPDPSVCWAVGQDNVNIGDNVGDSAGYNAISIGSSNTGQAAAESSVNIGVTAGKSSALNSVVNGASSG